MIRTDEVILKITYDDTKDYPPRGWDWAELIGDCWTGPQTDNVVELRMMNTD